MKHNNIHIRGIPEGLESKQRIENIFEKIMTKIFPNLVKDKDTQVQEAQRVPNKLDPKRPTLRHVIIEMTRLEPRTQRDRVTLKGLWAPTQYGWQAEYFSEWRIWAEPSAREWKAGDWTART